MSGLGSLLDTVGRFRPENPERVGVGVVLVGGIAAVLTLLVGSFVAVSGTLLGVLHFLAVLLPLIGTTLVLVTAWWGLKGAVTGETRPDPLVDGEPPERGSIRSVRDVSAGNPIDQAATDRYRCQRDEAATDVRGRLRDGAIRTLVTSSGLGRAAARDAIRTGEWTDDPVAAAFLSPTVALPPAERLRGAIDPGAAYTRRVRRTLTAIEAFGAATPAGSEQTPSGPERSAETAGTTAESGTDSTNAAVQEGAR
ncbi:hypothetical protein HLRTI_003082 [Halorhabdus tiamatea SARL4B]|uniref:Uncharacterized protein n=1 Tax=Halorhabdus tiamatea SARL4B TaxID=1033806 RepID=F7PGF4_9EURY|nr:hypothetical protein [Halorhabdus tiamatea]ERJ04964.1 hypothetical protein HLRTI_003082 [Halorhabdus tiamatea SARL4B]CCQ33843.1 conserved hypothetical protein [Halorhabdus tiamatea SARL4B]